MNNLKFFRQKIGLTSKQLAELAGTSQPQIFRLENGQRKLTKEWAVRLAPHLEVTPKQLLFSGQELNSLDEQIEDMLEHLSYDNKIKLLDLLSSFYQDKKE
ncbi:helix-turn-helix domain-containing protein [Bartonella raoultii]|uniref:Helix-turn-helix domain-containing protein n=1 Tax=Bartonella raoultii TaxID=1457020 RepID=A0ABS7I7U1_9HYPH|nr:helix-turn-helix transcriptional regulator [Bartonella raoultii]MBX4335664.1 helix-turn-helix domain-containing protein [Bartonella raoultii]